MAPPLGGLGSQSTTPGGRLIDELAPDNPAGGAPFDAFDEDAFLAAWEEAERRAAASVRRALRGVTLPDPAEAEVAAAAASLRAAVGSYGAGWALRAAGIDDPTAVPDRELVTAAVAATISMVEDPGLPPEETGAVMSLELADWAWAIVGVVRDGPGADASPEALAARVAEAAAEDGQPLDGDERDLVEDGFMRVVPAWHGAGVVDRDERLARLGAWLLPRAAMLAWTGDPEADPDVDGEADPDVDGEADPGLGGEADPGVDPVELWVARRAGRGWFEPDHWEPELSADEQELAAEVQRLVAAVGPVADTVLVDRLVADGLVGDGERDWAGEVAVCARHVYRIRDGRLACLPALAEGQVFTHRVSALELEEGRLEAGPDLDLYVTVVPPSLPVAGGGALELRYWEDPGDPDRGPSFFGPEGWLDGLDPGGLVACRLDGGEVTVRSLADADLDEPAAARTAGHLRATFDTLDGANDMGGPLDAPELLLETLVRYPAAFRRPVPPVTDLLGRAGLVDEGGAVLDPGAVGADAVRAYLADAYGLGDDGVDAVRLLAVAAERVAAGEVPDRGIAPRLVGLLCSDQEVAPALAEAVLEIRGGDVAQLERLVDALSPHAAGPQRAPLEFLRACCAEVLGDSLAGEQALRDAVAADPGYAPAHEDLAWYLEDRGEVRRALDHLRRAGVPEAEDKVRRLQRWGGLAGGTGRNDPCPCGSGSKYKKCCLARGGPLADRAGWLLDKATTFLTRLPQRPDVLPLIEARTGDLRDQRRLARAIEDGVVTDVALFEGGLLEVFLDDRGALLPDDEERLAMSWVGIRRSLYEVAGVRPGEGLDLLDLRSGERVAVRERLGSRQLQVGQAIFARVVPDGQGHQVAGGAVIIPVQHRQVLLEFLDLDPPAVEICAWVGALEGPPTLVTTEGQPTVFCTATYRVADPDQAAQALAERYEAAADGSSFAEWVEVDGRRWRRGLISLEGDELVIDTNAEERLDRHKAVVEEIVGGAELLDETRRPVAEVMAEVRRRGAAVGPPTPAFEDLEPEEQAIEAELRRREQEWVDESIPLFGGLTPRQALADPTRRGDVLAFLDEIDQEGEQPGQMSARRLRRLLGLA